LFVGMARQGTSIGYINAELSGFRIHGASISGSGRLVQAYREDWRRIFREFRGRDWRSTDQLWRLLYRAEGLGLRVVSWLQRLAK
jgi:hypothetical protein